MSEQDFLESVLGKCKHYQETAHGALTAINPYSGQCCICGRQVKEVVKQPNRNGDHD